MKKNSPSRKTADWQELASDRLARILKVASEVPQLQLQFRRKAGKPGTESGKKSGKLGTESQSRLQKTWHVEVKLVGKTVMSQLNSDYRKKNYPTDVLSFSAPVPFVQQGMLGELVICLPVLKSQAKTMKTPPEMELDVLLVHGVLHLLGFDHELGVKQATVMARWEVRILEKIQKKTKNTSRGLSLIERSNSGKDST